MEEGPACRQLFEQVFGQPIPETFWDWKYAKARGFSFLARGRKGEILGHYGAMVRQLHFEGETFPALQVCDVMVEQSCRGLLTRGGVFCRLARRFQEEAFAPDQPYRLAFGFPNARAMRLAEHLGLYEESDSIRTLTWRPLHRRPWVRVERLTAEPPAHSAQPLNTLWADFSRSHSQSVMTVRDADYWRKRYLAHPTHQYFCYLIRSVWRNHIIGALCLKVDGDEVKLMDVMCHPNRINIGVSTARWLVHRWGMSRLSAWATPAQAGDFEPTGPDVLGTDIRIPINRWVWKAEPSTFQGRWWISMGDTDFI